MGYYSNGYVEYNIRQINGYRLFYDIIEFGYRTGSGSIEMIEDATYYIVQEAGKNGNGISNFLKYELGEYKKTELPKIIYNLTFNGAERVNPEAKKEKGMPS